MATMGIDGLASGLDTTSLITQLMQVEAIPQQLLQTKSTAVEKLVTALQGLNARVASLGTAAKTAADPLSWQAFKATSTAAGATATASTKAQTGTVSFVVDSVARSQVSLSEKFTDPATLFTAVPPVMTVRKGDGTLVSFTADSGSLADITKAINGASDAGVKATAVRVSATTPPEYRLQLTGSATGTAGAFELFAGSAAEVTGGTATRLDAVTTTATNAAVTLWKGSPQEVSFSQSSNTFAGLMTGVDVTVSKVTAAGEDPVTVSVTRDEAALKKLASGIVGSMTVVLQEIGSQTATTKKTVDGRDVVTGGVLTGDSNVRATSTQLSSALAYPVDGESPSAVGIMLGKDGSFTFDEAKFSTALAADPGKVQSILTAIATRVATTATALSDPSDGSLSMKIAGQQTLVKSYGTEIEDWDRRLAVRKEGLQKTYSALEVTLSGLKAQSSWLASQLSSLPSYS